MKLHIGNEGNIWRCLDT